MNLPTNKEEYLTSLIKDKNAKNSIRRLIPRQPYSYSGYGARFLSNARFEVIEPLLLQLKQLDLLVPTDDNRLVISDDVIALLDLENL